MDIEVPYNKYLRVECGKHLEEGAELREEGRLERCRAWAVEVEHGDSAGKRE